MIETLKYYALVCACVFVSFASLAWGVFINDPVIIARGGSLISAMAALFVLILAAFELDVRKAIDSNRSANESLSQAGLSPVQALAKRIAKNRNNENDEQQKQRLLRFIASSAACAALGEFQEGFADMILKVLRMIF